MGNAGVRNVNQYCTSGVQWQQGFTWQQAHRPTPLLSPFTTLLYEASRGSPTCRTRKRELHWHRDRNQACFNFVWSQAPCRFLSTIFLTDTAHFERQKLFIYPSSLPPPAYFTAPEWFTQREISKLALCYQQTTFGRLKYIKVGKSTTSTPTAREISQKLRNRWMAVSTTP